MNSPSTADSGTALPSTDPRFDSSPLVRERARYEYLVELRSLLRNCAVRSDGWKMEPFTFTADNHFAGVAPNGGLEGFYQGLHRMLRRHAVGALLPQLDDYFRYLTVLTAPFPAAAELHREIVQLRDNEPCSQIDLVRASIALPETFAGRDALADRIETLHAASTTRAEFEREAVELFRSAGLERSIEKLEQQFKLSGGRFESEQRRLVRFHTLVGLVEDAVAAFRQQIQALDGGLWIKSADMYQIFARAANLEGWHRRHNLAVRHTGRFFADFTDADFDLIKNEYGRNAIHLLGFFVPSAELMPGTAAVSPFCIRDHFRVNPELGTESEAIEWIQRAHAHGIKVVTCMVFNHASKDSTLFAKNPEFGICRAATPDPANPGEYLAPAEPYSLYRHEASGKTYELRKAGYVHFEEGRGIERRFLDDVFQLDLSNQGLRNELVEEMSEFVSKYDIDGFRVDFAYQMSETYYYDKCGEVNETRPKEQRPVRPFLEEIVTELKVRHPRLAFTAEAHDLWDRHCLDGISAVLGKNDMNRPGDHKGWRDNIVSGEPRKIASAIFQRALYAEGLAGADMVAYDSDHDTVPLIVELRRRKLPEKLWYPLTALTVLAGGARLQQAGHEFFGPGSSPVVPPDETRSPGFFTGDSIDWTRGSEETEDFVAGLFRSKRALSNYLGSFIVEPVRMYDTENFAGFVLRSTDGAGERSARRVLVMANLGAQTRDLNVEIEDEQTAGRGLLERRQMNVLVDPYSYVLVPLAADGTLTAVPELPAPPAGYPPDRQQTAA